MYTYRVLCQGNVGLVFTKGDLKEVAEQIAKYRVRKPLDSPRHPSAESCFVTPIHFVYDSSMDRCVCRDTGK